MEIDAKIWLLITEGNEEAYEEMYFHYYRRFYVYGQKITSHIPLIEDAIQDVMIYIWQERQRLPEITNPAAYFYTFFRNKLVSKLRQLKLPSEDEAVNEETAYTPEQILLGKELAEREERQVKKAFSELTPRQREAIFLRFYQELPYEDIAGIMGITIKAAYKLMARSLAELKNNYIPVVILISFLCNR